MNQAFQATITGHGPGSAWTRLDIPFNVHQAFGSKAIVPVAGTLNGVPFRNSLMPKGDGTHYLHLRKDLLTAARVRIGDTVSVVLAKDAAPRTVTVPEDLQAALNSVPAQARIFAQLSYSHQKEFVDWIESARKPETRGRRVANTLDMLGERKRPKA